MRIYSTRMSIGESKPTLFAILETTLAMGFALVIASYLGTTFHLLVAASISPFLLIRSDASQKLGAKWFEQYSKFIESTKNYRRDSIERVCATILFHPAYIVGSFLIRISASLWHLPSGIRSIPDNWRRHALCVDSATLPELVPSTGILLPEHPMTDDVKGWYAIALGFICGVLIAGVSIDHPRLIVVTMVATMGTVWTVFIFFGHVACVLLAWTYRFSIKSTAIVWLPLAFVTSTTLNSKVSTSLKIELIRESSYWKLLRVVSWLTLAFFAWKLLVLPFIIEWWNSRIWTSTLNVYIAPNKIYYWHIASFANAIITLGTYLFLVDPATKMIDAGHWSSSNVRTLLNWIMFTSGMISIYTIYVGFMLTISACPTLVWTEFDFEHILPNF